MKIYASSYTNLKLNFILIGDDCIAMNNAHHMLTWYTVYSTHISSNNQINFFIYINISN